MSRRKSWLSVPHQKQHADGDCLAACALMVLSYLGRDVTYAQMLRLLKIKPHGAPARNILLLNAARGLNAKVVYSTIDMAGLAEFLRQKQPVIAFVKTGNLPYWTDNVDHAVVVVGVDETQVYVNDPDRDDGPISILHGDFELAWLERDYAYAQITKS